MFFSMKIRSSPNAPAASAFTADQRLADLGVRSARRGCPCHPRRRTSQHHRVADLMRRFSPHAPARRSRRCGRARRRLPPPLRPRAWEAILSPMASIACGVGADEDDTGVGAKAPGEVGALGRRKPKPGCTASAPVAFQAAMIFSAARDTTAPRAAVRSPHASSAISTATGWRRQPLEMGIYGGDTQPAAGAR